MLTSLPEARKREIDEFFATSDDFFRKLAEPISPVPVFLDIGCGDGYADLRVAEFFKPGKIILADIENILAVQLPPNAEFQMVDVCSPDFLKRFQNKVHVVFCMLTLHEFSNIFGAITNILNVLPLGGVAFFLDRTHEGWQKQCQTCVGKGAKHVMHLQQDIANMAHFGLNTNDGIRRFWKNGVFPRVPGETQLVFNGHIYTVVYIAKQWGQTNKPIPQDLVPQLRKLGYIK